MDSTLLLSAAGLCVTVGDLALAIWARTNSSFYLILGLILNLIGILFYAQTLRLDNIGVATAIFLGLNILAVTIGGFFLFHESLNLRKVLALFLLVISILLLEI